jgi:hypothetical protein
MLENKINLVFISIGDAEKLSTFLDANPNAIPYSNLFLVDGYDFAAYKTLGFGKIGENEELTIKGSKNMKAPDLGGFKGWAKYATTVGKVSPIPKDMKFGEVPEGVLRLGGTIGIVGNDVKYMYEDGVPGDYPDPKTVLATFV